VIEPDHVGGTFGEGASPASAQAGRHPIALGAIRRTARAHDGDQNFGRLASHRVATADDARRRPRRLAARPRRTRRALRPGVTLGTGGAGRPLRAGGALRPLRSDRALRPGSSDLALFADSTGGALRPGLWNCLDGQWLS
jgi:hypothetical protein